MKYNVCCDLKYAWLSEKEVRDGGYEYKNQFIQYYMKNKYNVVCDCNQYTLKDTLKRYEKRKRINEISYLHDKLMRRARKLKVDKIYCKNCEN